MPQYYHVPRYCGIYYVPHTTALVNVYSPQLEPPRVVWLPQVSVAVNSIIHDTSSSTTLTQTIVNPSTTDVIDKAKYNFPLYESCAVVAFRCFVGERLVHGVVKEKEEAKEEYKAAVNRGETAGLMEMHTPDVFSTSIGNIPAGETVKVEIEYIMELKHDAEVDGLRFTIPTSIAPRYGEVSRQLVSPSPSLKPQSMKIAVKLSMPSHIRSVQSPSHNISMYLGGHVEDVPDHAFNPKHALATLNQNSVELGDDFILLVKCAELSSPRALLETHPTIPDSKALMVTLVPKFSLPVGPKPEVVFVVDRSGSMESRMSPLRSALAVFLKSLPVGVKFNICSFGSGYAFLWDRSRLYSAHTLEEAQSHVNGMTANYGGTEILAPVKAVVSKRYKDIPLEIMVLTDGEIWDSDGLFKYIEQVAASGDIRVFSLGIGRDVSHALVEGMSRVGGGFAQIVSNEKEGLEGKVVRMLRGGLSPHIKDYRLEWDGRPTEGDATRESSPSPIIPKAKKKISLFDTTADTDPPISTSASAAHRFAHLPEFSVPSVIQAPYKLPTLFPFSRTTMYVILSNSVVVPSSIWLRGTTLSGDELELEIPVQTITEKNRTIHQLAARKLLQELEEGTSYLHSGKYGVDRVKNEGRFDEWVEREGVRVGVRYGVASKWTSFVAVERRKTSGLDQWEKLEVPKDGNERYTMVREGAGSEVQLEDDVSDMEDELSESDEDWGVREKKQASMEDLFVDLGVEDDYDEVGIALDCVVLREREVVEGGARQSAANCRTPETNFTAASIAGSAAAAAATARHSKLALATKARGRACPPSAAPPLLTRIGASASASSRRPPPPPPPPRRAVVHDASPISATTQMGSREDALVAGSVFRATKTGGSSTGWQSARRQFSVNTTTATTTPCDRAKALIALQTFEGYFTLSETFAQILNVPFSVIEMKASEQSQTMGGIEKETIEKLWATLLAVGFFERALKGEKEMWELVVEKAKLWIAVVEASVPQSQASTSSPLDCDVTGSAELKKLAKSAVEVLDGLNGGDFLNIPGRFEVRGGL